VSGHHVPEESAEGALILSEDSPVEVAQPVATAPLAPGHDGSARVAFGVA
jgi:hypothetical protein